MLPGAPLQGADSRIKMLAPLVRLGLLAAGLGVRADEGDDGDEYEWNNEAADLTCFVSGERASIQHIEGGYNVTNATIDLEGKMFVNLLLDDQDAQFELPGLLLRVSTAKYVESQMDDPFANIDDLKQGIWSTVGGNLLGMLFCVMGTAVIIFLEKRFKCIGGAKIHEMVEQQHKLQNELNHAVEFLKELDSDPSKAEQLAAQKMDEKNVPLSEEEMMKAVGKKAASKVTNGVVAGSMGGAKLAVVKKGANMVAETDEYAEAKEKAKAEGTRKKKKKKVQKEEGTTPAAERSVDGEGSASPTADKFGSAFGDEFAAAKEKAKQAAPKTKSAPSSVERFSNPIHGDTDADN